MTWLILGLVAVAVLALRRRGDEAARWMSDDEAGRKAAELQQEHGVTVGPERVLTPQEIAELSDRAKEKEEADRAAGIVRLTISLPAPITPIERGERFEDPLAEALGDLGEVDGGGSLMTEEDGKMVIVESNIDVYVRDVPRSLAVIRRTLEKQGAPKGTTITQHGEQMVEHALDE